MTAPADVSPRHETFAHEADIGVRGRGPDLASAFAQAALALTAAITDPAAVAAAVAVDIDCCAPDPELLLVDWLNRLIYEMATRKLLFGRFEVAIAGDRLHGRAWGEPIDPPRHQPAIEAKGATFTELRVAREADGRWVAQCVVDV